MLIAGIVGIAVATPIVLLTSPILAQGNQAADIHERGRALMSNGAYFRAELETEGPSTTSIQDAAYSVGGQNGWHSHPGLVAVTVLSGSIRWYDENCKPTVYSAGDSWVEGSKVHAFRKDRNRYRTSDGGVHYGAGPSAKNGRAGSGVCGRARSLRSPESLVTPGAASAGWRWPARGRVHEESVAPCRGTRLLHGAYPSTLDEERKEDGAAEIKNASGLFCACSASRA